MSSTADNSPECAFQTREATRADLPGVIAVQRHAFARVAEELGIRARDLPPLNETLDDLERLAASGTRFFVAVDEAGRIIGGARGTAAEESVHVGRLVVEDGWLRCGVGSAVMDLLEASFPHASRFELFTGIDARAPLALYLKRGYREFRREMTPATELVWLEKRASLDV